MSKIKKTQEISDFWNDCLIDNLSYGKPSNSNKKMQNLKNINNKNCNHLNKGKRNKKIYQYNAKLISFQSEIIKQDLLIEENNKSQHNKKILKSIEHMISLYDKAMLLKETHKKNIAQSNENTIKLEKEKCSFKPKLYRNKSLQNKIHKNFKNSTIYERGIQFQQQKIEKLAKLFEENYISNKFVCSFHPDIKSKDLNHVFYSDNFCKEQADNDSNKIFLFRLMKAREEKEYKKKCLESNINRNFEINWCCPKKLKRSISQKDSLLIQKKLHNNILNLKCLETHDSYK